MRYSNLWLLPLLVALTACDDTKAQDPADIPPAAIWSGTLSSDPALPQNREAFEDLFAEYQALNNRLDTVTYRLQKANVALCPLTQNSLGITVHTLSDYPDNLQEMAAALLGVDEHLSVRTVRQGSPAHEAGIMPGTKIKAIEDMDVPKGPESKLFYKAMKNSRFKDAPISLSEGENTWSITPEKLCAYEANVFYSERVNGHTDGRDVWITSELIRTVPDDVNLTLVVAHEMSHAIAGHITQKPSKALELEADRMALVLMARAGFPIEQAVGYWRDAPHPHDGAESLTHPTTDERYKNFRDTLIRIDSAKTMGEEISFRQ